MEQAIDIWRSDWSIQKVSTTGVEDISEFVEMSDGTREVPISLLLEITRVFEVQVLVVQGQRDGYRDGGASRSSDEVSVMEMEQRAGGLNERKRETMTGHSNTRMTRTTKLDRLRNRAQAHSETVFHNLGHMVTAELLYEAYQQLDEKKAVGIDKVDKETYGKELSSNISKLIKKIRRRQYRHKASRIVEIPKEDGSTRPLAISCFEDKMVEWKGPSVKFWSRYTSLCFCHFPMDSVQSVIAMMP